MSTDTKERAVQEHVPYVTSYSPAAHHAGWFRAMNAVMRRLLRTRFGERMQGLSLLSFRGRKTGMRYDVPVSVLDVDGTEVILTASPWRVNFRGGTDATVRAGRTTRRMHATLDEDPEQVAGVLESMLPEVGVKHSKRLGIVLAGERMPTHQELVEGVEGKRALITLTER